MVEVTELVVVAAGTGLGVAVMGYWLHTMKMLGGTQWGACTL